jgi:hypothetical protein
MSPTFKINYFILFPKIKLNPRFQLVSKNKIINGILWGAKLKFKKILQLENKLQNVFVKNWVLELWLKIFKGFIKILMQIKYFPLMELGKNN